MAPRSVRRLNREFGTEAIHAAAHHNHGVLCVGIGGSVFWIDRDTGTVHLGGDSTYRHAAFGDRPAWWLP
jgi:hypothetical protein